jgi:hypothetical protein
MSAPLHLPALPYEDWEPSKTTLHLWCQIIGKIRLAATRHRNHWWNMTLHPTARGFIAQRMRFEDGTFDIELDLVDHRVVVRSNKAHVELRDGLSVANFYAALFQALHGFGIRIPILARPYGVPTSTPFAQDHEHRSYDRVMVRRWWEAVLWSSDVLDEFAADFVGKQSVPHLFWHSFDLAMARYSGRPAAGPPRPDRVAQEAYSHEVIAFGFWAGDPAVPAPTYYTYTAPEPPGLTASPLAPAQAGWHDAGPGHLGRLPYDAVREAADPRAALLAFLRSGYEAGTRAAGWDVSAFRSAFPALEPTS